MKPRLTNKDYCRAAKRLNCDVAAIKAVAHVESRGDGFDAQGRPKILFERHIFARQTRGKYAATHPHICNYTPGGYGSESSQYARFSEAFYLNPEAAMMSASWGKFQIMGFNHKIAGFKTVGEFVDAMKESEGRHLDAFVEFVIANRLDDELRRLDWAGFARGYNGKNYAKNKYDTKMAAAYGQFKKENIDCNGQIDPFKPKPEPVQQAAKLPASDVVQPQAHQPVVPANIPAPPTGIIDRLEGYGGKVEAISDRVSAPLDKLGKVSQSSLWTTITGKIGAWSVLGFGLFEDKLHIIIIGAVILLGVLLYLHYSKKRATERITTATV